MKDKRIFLVGVAVIITNFFFGCECHCGYNDSTLGEGLLKTVKDLAPTIVALAALIFGYIGVERQRKTTIATTVNKEWVEKLRGYIATVILHAPTYANYIAANYTPQSPATPRIQNDFDVAYPQFTASVASLGLYLDVNNDTEQIALYNLITDLSEFCLTGQSAKVIPLIQQIRAKAQEVIRKKEAE